MSRYNNHHQIFTHSVDYGVIKGQYWKGTYTGANGVEYNIKGEVQCITCTGRVILETPNKLTRSRPWNIDNLILHAKIIAPVYLKPFTNTHGRSGVQIIREHIERNRIRIEVVGELRRNFTAPNKPATRCPFCACELRYTPDLSPTIRCPQCYEISSREDCL